MMSRNLVSSGIGQLQPVWLQLWPKAGPHIMSVWPGIYRSCLALAIRIRRSGSATKGKGSRWATPWRHEQDRCQAGGGRLPIGTSDPHTPGRLAAGDSGPVVGRNIRLLSRIGSPARVLRGPWALCGGNSRIRSCVGGWGTAAGRNGMLDGWPCRQHSGRLDPDRVDPCRAGGHGSASGNWVGCRSASVSLLEFSFIFGAGTKLLR